MENGGKIPFWIDCDPGHDDAFAISLAYFSQKFEILGISVVHGNDTVENCGQNVIRWLWTCGIKNIPVYLGMQTPLVRERKHCPEIHGKAGEQGVSGLCGYHFPDDIIFNNPEYGIDSKHGVIAMAESIKSSPQKVEVVLTGPHTNLAMAIRIFPEIRENIAKIVFMGGAIGHGNTGVASEFNCEVDPESSHIVFNSGIPITMVPLEVTHSVIVDEAIIEAIKFLDTSTRVEFEKALDKFNVACQDNISNRINDEIRKREVSRVYDDVTHLDDKAMKYEFLRCCIKMLTFFQSQYYNVFAFEWPPLHDPCAVFYLLAPEAFQTMEMFVDIETDNNKCLGRTLCDIHNVWGKKPNMTVCHAMDVKSFWKSMLFCIEAANEKSPLNSLNS